MASMVSALGASGSKGRALSEAFALDQDEQPVKASDPDCRMLSSTGAMVIHLCCRRLRYLITFANGVLASPA